MDTLTDSNAADVVMQIDNMFSFKSDGTTAASPNCKYSRWKSFMKRNKNHQFINLVQAQRPAPRKIAPRKVVKRASADIVMDTLTDSNAADVVMQIDNMFSFESDGTTAVSSSCKCNRWKRFMEHQKNHLLINLVKAQRAAVTVPRHRHRMLAAPNASSSCNR